MNFFEPLAESALRTTDADRHNALLEIEKAEQIAIECRAAGIDDTEHENHASSLRREFCKQFGRG